MGVSLKNALRVFVFASYHTNYCLNNQQRSISSSDANLPLGSKQWLVRVGDVYTLWGVVLRESLDKTESISSVENSGCLDSVRVC